VRSGVAVRYIIHTVSQWYTRKAAPSSDRIGRSDDRASRLSVHNSLDSIRFGRAE
jgi:hypothetical protein